ncbi:MAG: GTP-binding protein, partial [Thermoanaerobaculia bacterium]
ERGVGKLLSLSTAQDRTIYFDLLPIELGNIKGYTVRFQVCTVPGQVFYNETRKIVLRGVDGLVFVVDSQWSMLSHNLECFQNLKENLHEEKIQLETLPVVIQYNKRDLPSALSVEALQDSLGFHSYPFVETVASEGAGVIETFKLVSKLTFVDLLRRLQRGWQPPPPEPAADIVEAPEAAVAATLPAPTPEMVASAPAVVEEEAPVFAAASSASEPEGREEPRDDEAEAWVVPSAEGAFPDLKDDSKGSSTAPAVEPLPAAEPPAPAPRDEPEPATLAPAVLLAALATAPPPAPAPPPSALVPPPSSPAIPALGKSSSVDEKLNAVLAEARKSAGRMSGVFRRLEAHEGSTQEIPARELTDSRLEESIAGLRAEMSAEIARLSKELADAQRAASNAESTASEAAERALRLENALRQALHGLAG